MKIALLGFDRQGRSAYHHWNSEENTITVCDKNTSVEVPQGATAKLGDDYLDSLDQFDLLVRTPGLHPQKIVGANLNAPDILSKVTTVTNEFFRVCPTKNIIGVTGTKGKGTTSTLVANMLHEAGKNVHLGGNIGLSPLEMLHGAGFLGDGEKPITQDDWVVLELANFQLIDMNYSPHIAVCLMVVPEHLDWHTSLEEYLRAKQRIFIHQDEQDIAIYNPTNNRSTHIGTSSLGRHTPYLRKPGAYVENDTVKIDNATICPTSDIQLLGDHNYENVCAAVTCVWQVTQDASAIAAGIRRTQPLPFRIEQRGTKDGISYINDSFATNPGATIAAIRAVQQPKVLLLGGFDRGLDFSELGDVIHEQGASIRHIVLYGESRGRIKEALSNIPAQKITLLDDQDLERIVKTARATAAPGDAVVLSPACASFDMFKNFEERGKAFNTVVEQL